MESKERYRNMIAELASGVRPGAVAQKHGVLLSTLQVLRQSPMWKALEKDLHHEIVKETVAKVQRMIPAALEVLDEGMRPVRVIEVSDGRGGLKTVEIVSSMKDRISAAKETFSRAGVKGDEEIQDPVINITMNAPRWARDSEEDVEITVGNE